MPSERKQYRLRLQEITRISAVDRPAQETAGVRLIKTEDPIAAMHVAWQQTIETERALKRNEPAAPPPIAKEPMSTSEFQKLDAALDKMVDDYRIQKGASVGAATLALTSDATYRELYERRRAIKDAGEMPYTDPGSAEVVATMPNRAEIEERMAAMVDALVMERGMLRGRAWNYLYDHSREFADLANGYQMARTAELRSGTRIVGR